MRFIIFIVSTFTLGMLGVTQGVIPFPTQTLQALVALGGNPAQVKTINPTPVDAYSTSLPQILKGSPAPADLGSHGTAVTAPSGSFRNMATPAANSGAVGQTGSAAAIAAQVQQNNQRMQDLATYARNPSGWHGAPPH